MFVKDGMIVDGPHWAVGYALDTSNRTSADGDVNAYREFDAARKDFTATAQWANEEELPVLQIRHHDRPVSKCSQGCEYVGYPVSVDIWSPHWSVAVADGGRQWCDSEWYMGHLIANREGIRPVYHDTFEQCDCTED